MPQLSDISDLTMVRNDLSEGIVLQTGSAGMLTQNTSLSPIQIDELFLKHFKHIPDLHVSTPDSYGSDAITGINLVSYPFASSSIVLTQSLSFALQLVGVNGLPEYVCPRQLHLSPSYPTSLS